MSISTRSDGRIIVKFKDADGVWRQKSFKDMAKAEAFNNECLYDEPENERLTVNESIALYCKGTKLCAINRNKFALLVERCEGNIGDMYVDALTRRDLETFRDSMLSGGASVRTVNEYVGMLKRAWRYCCSEDALASVPWEHYRPLPGEAKPRHLSASIEDWRMVLGSCSEHVRWAMETCLALSLRPGKELCGLKWADVDLVSLRATVYMPKVGRSKSISVPLWWVEKARNRVRTSEFVCTGRNGERLQPAALFSAWKAASRSCGLNVPTYAVRHVSASTMLEAGADVVAVAAQLGHSNVTTTGAFYLHASQRAQASAVAMLPAPAPNMVRNGAEN